MTHCLSHHCYPSFRRVCGGNDRGRWGTTQWADGGDNAMGRRGYSRNGTMGETTQLTGDNRVMQHSQQGPARLTGDGATMRRRNSAYGGQRGMMRWDKGDDGQWNRTYDGCSLDLLCFLMLYHLHLGCPFFLSISSR
jgi:hypothetical protein